MCDARTQEARAPMRYREGMTDPMHIDVSGAVAIDRALEVVHRTLDKLIARGQDAAAFEIAKAEFRASVRASWPGNLGQLATALAEVEKDAASKLDENERAELRSALEVLRNVAHP